LNETVNRGEEIEEVATYPSDPRALKRAQVAAWQKRRADNEAAEKERIAAGGEPKPPSKFTQRARANYQAKLKAEKEIEEGVFSYDDSGRVRAKELDAEDLDASGEERLAFEKDPRGYSRHQHAISRSNAATNPPGEQDINQFLQQDFPEIWAMWNDVIADREARGKPFHRDVLEPEE
jgi:hypothetical protein